MARDIGNPPTVDPTKARPLEAIAEAVHATRWNLYHGTRGRNKHGLRLPYILVGKDKRTTIEAYSWWVNARAALDDAPTSSAPTRRKPHDRQRSIEAAEAELDALNIE